MLDAWVPGVGISSIRERASEVGGWLQMSNDKEGSLVRAVLPIGRSGTYAYVFRRHVWGCDFVGDGEENSS
jgi:signal transduction histidine kinase